MADAAEIVSILQEAAAAANLPPQLVIACAYAESRLNPLGRRPADPLKYRTYWLPPDPFDISGGLGQKVVRYMQPYLDWCKANGRNPDEYPGDDVIDAMLDMLNDPREAARIMCADLASKWRVYGPNLEKTLAAYNWPAGGGAFYTPEHAANYRTGLEAAARILGEPPVTVPFNSAAKIDAQPDDFSCSIQSAKWLLRALGRNPGDAWIYGQLLDSGIVRRDVGLTVSTGQQLANWITEQYGKEMGFTAQASPVTWDDVWAGAGTNPMICGGRTFGSGGHWIGIRGRNADGTLSIANSADGYTGIGQAISREQWDARGPWSCVWLDRGAAPVTPPAPTPSRAQTLLAEIEARVAELKSLVA